MDTVGKNARDSTLNGELSFTVGPFFVIFVCSPRNMGFRYLFGCQIGIVIKLDAEHPTFFEDIKNAFKYITSHWSCCNMLDTYLRIDNVI